jgi:hypothetical protein
MLDEGRRRTTEEIMLINVTKVELLNGKTIKENEDGYFPAMQEFDGDCKNACYVCPIEPVCGRNNEFDCMVNSMFSGFYVGFEEVIKLSVIMREKGIRI